MKRILSFIVAAALYGALLDSSPAHAADAAIGADLTHETPLMVIRFNDAHTDYAMPLYNTISRALEVKPSAVFDIVSIAPRAHKGTNQPYFNRLASENTHKVLTSLNTMGLPASRISLVEAIDDVSASEVRIFIH